MYLPTISHSHFCFGSAVLTGVMVGGSVMENRVRACVMSSERVRLKCMYLQVAEMVRGVMACSK